MQDVTSTNSISNVGLNAAGNNAAVEKTSLESAAKKSAEQAAGFGPEENVTISQTAKEKAKLELQGAKYARMAQRLEEPMDHQKVEKFKALVASGNTANYLNGLDTNAIAKALLAGPTGKFLAS